MTKNLDYQEILFSRVDLTCLGGKRGKYFKISTQKSESGGTYKK